MSNANIFRKISEKRLGNFHKDAIHSLTPTVFVNICSILIGGLFAIGYFMILDNLRSFIPNTVVTIVQPRILPNYHNK